MKVKIHKVEDSNKKRKGENSPENSPDSNSNRATKKSKEEGTVDQKDVDTIIEEEKRWIKQMKDICKRAEKPAIMERVPDEIIAMIFAHFSWRDLFMVGRVSPWFYCYINSNLPQWSHIDITQFSEDIKDLIKGETKQKKSDAYWKIIKKAIQMFARFGREAVVSMKLSPKSNYGPRKYTPHMDDTLEILAFHCPNIEELGLSFCKLSDDTLVRMIRKSSKLIKLYFKGTPISGGVLKAIAEMGQCEALDISAQGKHDDERKNSWMRGLPFPEEQFYLLGQACRNSLKTIRLKRTSFSNPKTLIDFFTSCRKLERVSAGLSIVDDKIIKVLVENNPHLTHLKILLSKVTDEGLVTVSNNCKDLLFLDAKFNEGTTASAIDQLTKGVCKKLQYLSVYLPNIPPHHLISIFKAFPDLVKLDIAQSLLDDDTLSRIAELRPTLLSLNVSETNLSNDGIQYLSSFENLVELTIGLENITHSLLQNIPKACPRLRILRIRQESISEESAMKLIKSLTHLRELEFISQDCGPQKKLIEFANKVNPDLKIVMNETEETDEMQTEGHEGFSSSDDEPDEMIDMLRQEASNAADE